MYACVCVPACVLLVRHESHWDVQPQALQGWATAHPLDDSLLSARLLPQNTTPDDVPICEAYLAFLRSNGDNVTFWRVLTGGTLLWQPVGGRAPPRDARVAAAASACTSLRSLALLCTCWRPCEEQGQSCVQP